jgi:hypothetical protein
MLARWGIRIGTSLAGIALGVLLSSAVLAKFSVNATAVLEATVLFWVIHIGVQVLALRVLVRQPSIALAGLLALASTVVSLIIVNAIVSGLTIRGLQTYVLATLIIWLTTSLGDIVARQLIKRRSPRR